MNVLFWSETYPPSVGGAGVWGSRFVDALIAHGHRVLVVTGGDTNGESGTCGVDDGGRVRRLPFRESLTRHDVFGIRATIAQLKRRFRPDVVHLSSAGPSLFYHLVTRQAWRAPTLITLHGWSGRRPSQDTLLRRVIDEADRVVGVSHAVLRETLEMAPIPKARCSVIHHGIDWPHHDVKPLTVDPPVLVCLGRLVREKGFDVALEALGELRRRIPTIRLLLAGDGPDGGALRRRAQELGLGRHVTFVGAVAPADVPSLLSRASVVVIPSRAEAFGLVALEAAALGRPVIASRVGGLPEVIESGRTGVLVGSDQPAALAEATRSLLSDLPRLRAMGDAARARARIVFPWKSCVDSYLDHYAAIQRSVEPC
jgi:glycogen(starch) synthase